jgi:hypothetical protein
VLEFLLATERLYVCAEKFCILIIFPSPASEHEGPEARGRHETLAEY